MRNLIIVFCIVAFLSSCTRKSRVPLVDRIEEFKISPCQDNCGIDSIGIRRNEVIDNVFYAKMGYIVNCAWEDGFLESITLRNDTLLIGIDRPAEIDTLKTEIIVVNGEQIITTEVKKTYPLYDCDCFFYFELSLKEISETPKIVRLFEVDAVNDNGFWDEINKRSFEVEETQIDF